MYTSRRKQTENNMFPFPLEKPQGMLIIPVAYSGVYQSLMSHFDKYVLVLHIIRMCWTYLKYQYNASQQNLKIEAKSIIWE